MEHECNQKDQNGCFATVGQHPILLAVHAAALMALGTYLAQSAPEDAALQAALTSGYLLKLWLTTTLMLSGILVAGILPGFTTELAAMVVLGGQMLSPLPALACGGNLSYFSLPALFVRILALLLTGVLAGSTSLQVTRHWAAILAFQLRSGWGSEIPDELFPPLSEWKALFGLLVRRIFRVVLPLSVLIAGPSVWIL